MRSDGVRCELVGFFAGGGCASTIFGASFFLPFFFGVAVLEADSFATGFFLPFFARAVFEAGCFTTDVFVAFFFVAFFFAAGSLATGLPAFLAAVSRAASGLEPIGSTPDQFAAQIRADTAQWAKVVRAANIRAE